LVCSGRGGWPDRDVHIYRPRPLQRLRLLAEDAQLETKRSNEGDTSPSETSEALRASRANDSVPLSRAG
jgi:hypothetical protein